MDTFTVILIVAIAVAVIIIIFAEGSSSGPLSSLSGRLEFLMPSILSRSSPTYIYYNGRFHKYYDGVITNETISVSSDTNVNVNVISPIGTPSLNVERSDGSSQSMGEPQSPGVFNYTFTGVTDSFVITGLTPEPPLGSAYMVTIIPRR